MPAADLPWYENRWLNSPGKRRAVGYSAAPKSGPNLTDNMGNTEYGGGAAPWFYLLQAFRANPPGYDLQNTFELARQIVGCQYLAIHYLQTQAYQAEFKLEEVDPSDPDVKRPVSRYDEAWQLLERPNPEESFGDILEQTVQQWQSTGTGLIWSPIDPSDPYQRPQEMYVLPTASVLPMPVSPLYPNGAYMVQPWYPAGPFAMIPSYTGVGATIPAEQVTRVKDPHPLMRWAGYATMFAISQQIDTVKQVDIARNTAMAKGIDPSFALSFDKAAKIPNDRDLRRMEVQLQQVYGGPENVSKVFLTPGGGTLTKLSNVPRDMEFEKGWAQIKDFVLDCFGARSASMSDGLTYATLFAALKAFYVNTLGPILHRFARRFERGILHEYFSRDFVLTLTPKKITDEEQRNRDAETLARHGAIKVGELRKMYDLAPSDRDEEWLKAMGRAGLPGQGDEGGQGLESLFGSNDSGGGERENNGAQGREPTSEGERQVNSTRPRNESGAGSLGPRKSLVMLEGALRDRNERLAKALEKSLTNGSAKPNGRS